MQYPRLFFICAVFVLAICTDGLAQSGREPGSFGNVRIRVIYANGHPASKNLLVRLMNGASTTPVSDSYTSDAGWAEFNKLPGGFYHVVVTGDGIEPADSGLFEVDYRKAAQTQFVTVYQEGQLRANREGKGAPVVTAADLNIPKDAQKQFDKAGEAMARQDWRKALSQLNVAISIYPRYASAYNNLGVVYTRMHDISHAHEALNKAISLNDHFASALQNLARLYLQEQKPMEAETLLERAVAAEPNAQTLLLLSQAQLLDRNYDAAIANARKVHALPHDGMALTHYIAARALESENQPQEAVAELRMFLREDPQNARAAQAREEIKNIERRVPPAAPSPAPH